MLIYLVVNKQNNLSFKEETMKRLLLAATISLGTILPIYSQVQSSSFVESAAEKATLKEDKLQNAILWINHINLVVTKILTYNNKLVLTLEYEKLMDSINYNNLPAGNLQASVRELMEALKDLSNNWDEREYVLDLYRRDCDNVFRKACLNTAKDVVVWVGNTAKDVAILMVSPASGATKMIGNTVKNNFKNGDPNCIADNFMFYADARMQLSRNFAASKYELAVENKKRIQDLRDRMWESFSTEFSETELKDQQRFSVRDCEELLLILKQNSSSEQFYVLNGENNRRRFKYFPAYWYYLAVTANSIGKEQCSLDALKHFKESYRNLLRNDEYVINMLILETQFLLKKEKEKNSVLKVITMDRENERRILQNLSDIEIMIFDKDWKSRYFVAVCYGSIGRYEKAEALLRQNIAILKALQKENSPIKYRNFLGDENIPLVKLSNKEFPVGDNLALNRTMLFNMRKHSLEEKHAFLSKIGSDVAVSAYEKMQYQGAVENDKIFVSLEKDFVEIKGCLVNRSIKPFVEVLVPKTWFYTAQSPTFHLAFFGEDKKVLGKNSYVPKSADYNKTLSAFVIRFPFNKSTTPFEKIEMASLLIEGEFISAELHFKVLKNKKTELGQNEPVGKWDKLKKWSKKTLDSGKRMWSESADFKLVSVTFGGKTYNITEESK